MVLGLVNQQFTLHSKSNFTNIQLIYSGTIRNRIYNEDNSHNDSVKNLRSTPELAFYKEGRSLKALDSN